MENALEIAIGHEVRACRLRLKLTVVELAEQAGLSPGMLSKIENGGISPSLSTLSALSRALNVPVTAFLRRYEEQRDCTLVKAGEGLSIKRRGSRAGHIYQLLGHTVTSPVAVEPYLITLTEESEVFPLFQHAGVELVYVLEGELVYRHGEQSYSLSAGDSLFFDSDAPHGPEEFVETPVRLLAVLVQPPGA
jgi:transcriptional regulator with XRE-family HTH domain